MVQLSAAGYWAIPPITRTLLTWTAVVSTCAWMGITKYHYFLYTPQDTWQLPPQLWRLVTGFFIARPGLGLIFDTYFMYTYLRSLETGHPRLSRRADVIWYLMFVGATILTLDHFIAWTSNVIYIRPLTVAMAYTVTQQQQGLKGHFVIFEIPAPLVPLGMIAYNMFTEGPEGVVFDGYGLLAGHLYEFLTKVWPRAGGGFNPIPTPSIVTKIVGWFEGNPRATARSWGTMFTPSSGGGSGSSGSSATASGADRGPLPDSWRTRGAGRRLGS